MGNINITDKAIIKIQEVLKEQNMKYFRIRVKGGGCSGFQYVFKSEDSINENKDIIFNFKNLQILIDKNSMERDTTVDWANHDHCGSQSCTLFFDNNDEQEDIKISIKEDKLIKDDT